jgi:hypothetical protein
MNKFLMNRKKLAALIAAFLLVLGSGVAYTQSLPAQMVEMLLNSQFNKVKPESFHRVFQQWQRAEYGFVRNSFDQVELQSVAQSFTMWMIFNDPFTDEDYVKENDGNTPAPSASSRSAPQASAPSQQAAPQSSATGGFQATHRVITNDRTRLRLRDNPSFSGRQIDSLDYGSYVKVLETGGPAVDGDGYRGNWMRVVTPGGNSGWCFGAYLQAIN